MLRLPEVGIERGERSTVQGTFTILFTDLKGSRGLRVRVGDTAANEIIRLHDDLIRSRLEIAGAVETKSLGGGIMAQLASANQAVSTAALIQRAIEDPGRIPTSRCRCGWA